jgi:SNF2 family DNA or RNA helicase
MGDMNFGSMAFSGAQQPRIDFDKATSRFIIATPMWMADKTRGIPNRRWNNNKRIWTAPAIRMNASYLREHFPYNKVQWSEEAKRAAEEALRPVEDAPRDPFPASYIFKTRPRPKQMEALNRSWGVNVFAFFKCPGSGKTKTSIDLHSARYLAGQIDAVVVVCPFSVKQNWVEQIQIHSPVPTTIATLDLDKGAGVEFEEGKLRWLIVGIESLQSSVRAFESLKDFTLAHRGAMVVDESSRIKNPDAVRAQRCADIGKRCKYRSIMTGTEITQGILDLYMQFEFLDPQIIGIGDWYSFRNRYAIMGGFRDEHGRAKEIVGYQNVDELMEIIRPFTIVVTKEEALPELPPKTFTTRVVRMNEEQRRMYKELKTDLLTEIAGKEIEPKNVLEQCLRLQEVSCGFYSIPEEDPISGKMTYRKYPVPGKDPKIAALMEFLEETPGKVIIWSRFRFQIAAIADALRKGYGPDSVVEFHGGIDEGARKVARRRFQDKNDPVRFFVGNQTTGGIGIDLFAASVMVYMCNTFSLEDRIQSEDRMHRIGQDAQKMLYVDVVAEGTIDRMVLTSLSQKLDLATFVKGALKEGSLKTALG